VAAASPVLSAGVRVFWRAALVIAVVAVASYILNR
jgi:hypothetical protein